MKKLLAILLAVVMLLSVTACSKTGTDTPDGTTQNSGDGTGRNSSRTLSSSLQLVSMSAMA